MAAGGSKGAVPLRSTDLARIESLADAPARSVAAAQMLLPRVVVRHGRCSAI